MNKKKYVRASVLMLGILIVVVCWQNLNKTGSTPVWKVLGRQLQGSVYMEMLKTHMPTVLAAEKEPVKELTFQEYFMEKLGEWMPVEGYILTLQEYDTQVESTLTYEMLMAREGADEAYRDGELLADVENTQSGVETGEPAAASEEGAAGAQEAVSAEGNPIDNGAVQETGAVSTGAFTPTIEPMVQISREKLNDFDYLIQNFYTVDKTTTIDGGQLNAQELLAKDMHLTTTADKPQILIHHTHSQERYADSNGDASTSIVGVGEYLTKLLREQYGLNVIHDTGVYDVIDHDNAYAYAGPAVEQILADNPSIEVVIDLHRDGIKEGVHLVTEVNGKQTARIMFFNGLSRTTANGNLDELPNPYLSDNLAFSLQMKIAAEEYYPGFARANYLKGYRYNLHYRPKSILVEVGAQTNTVQEAMNAMEPLADLLHKVLVP